MYEDAPEDTRSTWSPKRAVQQSRTATPMIVQPGDQDSRQLPDSKSEVDDGLETSREEPPPSYTDSAASGSIPSSSSRTFKTKPTNSLALSNEHSDIRGEFVIDPSICIPPPMLPPLGEGETEDDRRNLCLTSKFGSVHADIWLLGPTRDGLNTHKPRRTSIVLASDHGSIRAQVQTLDGAAPFSLMASASHGAIRLSIPRSFQGLLSLSTRHGSISVSDAIVENATQLSQLGTTRRYFVGDFHLLGEDEWGGDQVEINGVHGSVRVRYVNEVVDAQGKKGFLSWLFGK